MTIVAERSRRSVNRPSTSTVSEGVVRVKPSGVKGVRLAVGPVVNASETAFADLLIRHAPVFMLYPDAAAGSRRPYPNGRHDYHPRPVEAFLDKCHPFVAAPRGLFGWLIVALLATLLVSASAFSLLGLAGVPSFGVEVPIIAALSLAVVTLVQSVARPISRPALIRRVLDGDSMADLGIRHGLRPPQRNDEWARKAWRDYRTRIVAHPLDYPPTIYGRGVRHGEDVYLEYWQFYVFNDWHNVHEADWEYVTIRVAKDESGKPCPSGAAYSSHLGGLWRNWDDVETTADGHPVVYVAKGSHAQYFEARSEGYRATLIQPWDAFDIRGRLDLQPDWVDRVVAEASSDGQYTLVTIPDSAADPTLQDLSSTWWWLRFDGFWGARDGIFGPAFQPPKWDMPWRWVAEQCVGDPGTWATRAGAACPDDQA